MAVAAEDNRILVPTEDRLLVKVHRQTETKSGLFLPQNFTDGQLLYGTVLATGPGRHYITDAGKSVRKNMLVAVDDEIIFHKDHGWEVERDVRLIDEAMVLSQVVYG